MFQRVTTQDVQLINEKILLKRRGQGTVSLLLPALSYASASDPKELGLGVFMLRETCV